MGVFSKVEKDEPPTALNTAGPDIEQGLKCSNYQKEHASINNDTQHVVIEPELERQVRRKLDRNLVPLVFVFCMR